MYDTANNHSATLIFMGFDCILLQLRWHAIIAGKRRYYSMSHTDRNTFGLEHGKIGDRIAVVLDGKQIYKKLYKPTNPRTPKQQMHRAKIAFINRLSSVLADAVNVGFEKVPEPGSGHSPRNAFVKENWDNGALVWTERKQSRANGLTSDEREEDEAGVDASGQSQGNDTSGVELTGEWGIVPQQLVVAYGPRYIGQRMTASVRDGKLYVSCPDPGLDDSHAVGDDRLMAAVYRHAVPTVHLYPGPLRKNCHECCFDLPTDISDEENLMHIYAWFRATTYHRSGGGKITVRPGQASPSVYLGSFNA